MPLLLNVAPVRVELTTPGEWVEIKSRLSKGDQARVRSAAFKVQAGLSQMSTGAVDVALDYEATVFAGLEVGIVAWSFEEPVTPVNIRALDAADYDVITARANELWAPRGDQEAKDLSGSGAPRSSTAEAFPPSSNG